LRVEIVNNLSVFSKNDFTFYLKNDFTFYLKNDFTFLKFQGRSQAIEGFG